jgi:hypothetical protein
VSQVSRNSPLYRGPAQAELKLLTGSEGFEPST